MRLLVFVGPKGSGKDAAYEILRKNKLVKNKLAFAEPLKQICASVFDLGLPLLNDPVLKEHPLKTPITVNIKHLRAIRDLMTDFVDPYDVHYNVNKMTQEHIGKVFNTPREMLQYVGTEIIRKLFNDWHCEAAFSQKFLSRPKYSKHKSGVFAVTDCRFPNEMATILKYNSTAKFYYVERPKAEKELEEAAHSSELLVLDLKKKIVDQFGKEAILKNSGSLKSYEKLLLDTITKEMLDEMKSTNTLENGQLVEGSKFRWAAR